MKCYLYTFLHLKMTSSSVMYLKSLHLGFIWSRRKTTTFPWQQHHHHYNNMACSFLPTCEPCVSTPGCYWIREKEEDYGYCVLWKFYKGDPFRQTSFGPDQAFNCPVTTTTTPKPSAFAAFTDTSADYYWLFILLWCVIFACASIVIGLVCCVLFDKFCRWLGYRKDVQIGRRRTRAQTQRNQERRLQEQNLLNESHTIDMPAQNDDEEVVLMNRMETTTTSPNGNSVTTNTVEVTLRRSTRTRNPVFKYPDNPPPRPPKTKND